MKQFSSQRASTQDTGGGPGGGPGGGGTLTGHTNRKVRQHGSKTTRFVFCLKKHHVL